MGFQRGFMNYGLMACVFVGTAGVGVLAYRLEGSPWRWPLVACSGFNARHRHVPTPAREMALCIRPAIAGVDRKIQTAFQKSSGGPAEPKF